MGLHDVDTMNKIREKLNTIDERIIMYGEAWNLGSVDGVELAIQSNIKNINGVAAFNDGFRDTLKGNNFEAVGKGYVQGKSNFVDDMSGLRSQRAVKRNEITLCKKLVFIAEFNALKRCGMVG